jgi:hypothetical protein
MNQDQIHPATFRVGSANTSSFKDITCNWMDMTSLIFKEHIKMDTSISNTATMYHCSRPPCHLLIGPESKAKQNRVRVCQQVEILQKEEDTAMNFCAGQMQIKD